MVQFRAADEVPQAATGHHAGTVVMVMAIVVVVHGLSICGVSVRQPPKVVHNTVGVSHHLFQNGKVPSKVLQNVISIAAHRLLSLQHHFCVFVLVQVSEQLTRFHLSQDFTDDMGVMVLHGLTDQPIAPHNAYLPAQAILRRFPKYQVATVAIGVCDPGVLGIRENVGTGVPP